jgi:hypothetical protein
MIAPVIAGHRIGNETLASILESERIRPLRNAIIVEPLEWRPSEIIWVAYTGRPLKGIVRAAGSGTYPKCYNAPRGPYRNRSWDSKYFRPNAVKVGDVVELGGGELGGYLFKTLRWGDKEMLYCTEDDVCGICEG